MRIEDVRVCYYDQDSRTGGSGHAHLRPIQGDKMENDHETVVTQTGAVEVLKQIFDAPDWFDGLKAASSPEVAARYPAETMVKATGGMGYCIDERKAKYLILKGLGKILVVDNSNKAEVLTPGFVGGFGGWVVMYMMRGLEINEAMTAVDKLYAQMKWDKQAHIDNDHGHKQDPNDIASLRVGCGFLSKAAEIIAQARGVLTEAIAPGATYDPEKDGKKIIEHVLDTDGTVVVVTGNHTPANVVLNLRESLTLDRTAINDENPTYLWDVYASTSDAVFEAFLSFDTGNNKLNLDQFKKMQAFMHVSTGFALKALDISNPGKNLAVLE